jgi:hypothetical protein
MSTRNDVDLLAVSQFEFGKPLLSVSTVASIGAAMGSGHSISEPAKNDRGCEAVIVGIKWLSTYCASVASADGGAMLVTPVPEQLLLNTEFPVKMMMLATICVQALPPVVLPPLKSTVWLGR